MKAEFGINHNKPEIVIIPESIAECLALKFFCLVYSPKLSAGIVIETAYNPEPIGAIIPAVLEDIMSRIDSYTENGK